VRRLLAGESVALVSDAGTPAISDPGMQFVAAAHEANIRVEPIPGPSAALAAVSASGLPADQILFVGFPPSRASARKRWFAALKAEPRSIVFYEAPHRIRDSLQDLQTELGNRLIAVGRELTKAHENLVVRHISDYLMSMQEPRGEYTVVVEPPGAAIAEECQLPDNAALLTEFGDLTNFGPGTRRDAIKQLAAKYRVPSRKMYQLLETARRD
jgi:16S rRNA (cytidine1402-2'-O)-methyltransferase